MRPLVLLASALLATISGALRCLEGADCIDDASCRACEGVACTRIISKNPEDNAQLALTCLPFDTRQFGHLEVEGCRLVTDSKQICTCYGSDYCNGAARRGATYSPTVILPLLLPLVLPFLDR